MALGGHKGKRVALAVPPGIHDQLTAWADLEGRPVASLCMSIIEMGIRQAVKDGVIRPLGQESGQSGSDDMSLFSQNYRGPFNLLRTTYDLSLKEAWILLSEKLNELGITDEKVLNNLRDTVAGFEEIDVDVMHQLSFGNKPFDKALTGIMQELNTAKEMGYKDIAEMREADGPQRSGPLDLGLISSSLKRKRSSAKQAVEEVIKTDDQPQTKEEKQKQLLELLGSLKKG